MESLSIIIPCYNEGEKLLSNISKIKTFIFSSFENDLDFEIIIVNDGSTDNSKKIFEDYCKQDSLCKFITYDINKGKGYAVREGIKSSTKEVVVFMDADLSTDITALLDVYENIGGTHIIIGSRRHPKSILIIPQGKRRRFVGKMCSLITNFLMSFNISDTQCGFKAFKGSVARELVLRQTINRFAFDVELLYIGYLNGYVIKEIPVIWENDEDSKVKLVGSSFKFMRDLIKIKLNKKHYIYKKEAIA